MKTYLLAATLAGALMTLMTASVTAEDLRPNAAPSSADFRALGEMPLPIAAMTAEELGAVRGAGLTDLLRLLLVDPGPIAVVNLLLTNPTGAINAVVATLLTPPILP